jgi:hypothetical protein
VNNNDVFVAKRRKKRKKQRQLSLTEAVPLAPLCGKIPGSLLRLFAAKRAFVTQSALAVLRLDHGGLGCYLRRWFAQSAP